MWSFRDPDWLFRRLRGGQGVLILSIAVAAVIQTLLGNFTPRVITDTASYLRIGSLQEILGGQRTPFYGWIVQAVEPFAPDYALVPWLQFFGFSVAIIFLYRAALRYGLSEPAALALSAPLLFSNAALLFTGNIHPEIFAISLLLGALATVLIIARERAHWAWYVLGGILLGLGYLLKPGFLLFVGLLPVLLILLARHVRSADWQTVLQRAVIVGIIGALPFMIYSSVRYAAVDHFHIVSFSGYTGTGLSAQIMDEETIDRLPKEFRSVARRVLEERERLEDKKIVLPIPVNSTNGEPVYWSAVLGYFDIFARNYDHMISVMAQELRKDGQSWVELNSKAQAFSRAVIREEPVNYVLYVVGASTRFSGLLVAANATLVPALVFLILVVIVRSFEGWRGLEAYSTGRALIENGVPLFLIALVYVVASYVPAVAMTFPARRYVDTAGILMAAFPLYVAWLLWTSRD